MAGGDAPPRRRVSGSAGLGRDDDDAARRGPAIVSRGVNAVEDLDGEDVCRGDTLQQLEIVQALLNYPSYYYAGAVGPDGFPDFTFGQWIFHPTDTGVWVQRPTDSEAD